MCRSRKNNRIPFFFVEMSFGTSSIWYKVYHGCIRVLSSDVRCNVNESTLFGSERVNNNMQRESSYCTENGQNSNRTIYTTRKYCMCERNMDSGLYYVLQKNAFQGEIFTLE